MDIVPRVFSADRIQGKTVYISFQCGDNRPQVIDGLPDSVKSTSQHIRGKGNFHGMAGQFCVCIFQGHVFRPLKYLYDGPVLIDFYNAADFSLCAVYDEFHDFVVESVLYALQCNQRTVDTA